MSTPLIAIHPTNLPTLHLRHHDAEKNSFQRNEPENTPYFLLESANETY
jgi:hypothetical protein